jgi:hypothetical protein
MVEQVEATQDDINAAQRICGLPADPAHIQADKVVQAFRDHRIAAEARGKAEIERLREALRPFAECAEQISEGEDDEEWAKFRLLIKDYRNARAALKANQ